jgi:hypothetical protein
MSYETSQGEKRAIGFSTRVLRRALVFAPMPPSACYELLLEAGAAPALHVVPLHQELASGAADHFVLRLGTNKSAQFDLNVSFKTIGAGNLSGGDVSLEIFVPRSQTGFIEKAKACPAG